MANAIRTGDQSNPKIVKFDELEQYIYSFSKDFGFEKFFEYDKKYEEYFPTREFEENTEIDKLHQEYDEDSFWEELIFRLSDRDFLNRYTSREISNMTIEERIKKEQIFRDKWYEETEKYGIERIDVKK